MWQMVRMLVGTSLAFDWAWGTNQPTSCPLAMESKKTPKAGEANGLIIILPAVGVRELVMFFRDGISDQRLLLGIRVSHPPICAVKMEVEDDMYIFTIIFAYLRTPHFKYRVIAQNKR